MTYLFTHDDLDGVGSAVVAYLAYPGSLTVKYCSYKTINSEITALLDSLQSTASILIADINVDGARKTCDLLDHQLELTEAANRLGYSIPLVPSSLERTLVKGLDAPCHLIKPVLHGLLLASLPKNQIQHGAQKWYRITLKCRLHLVLSHLAAIISVFYYPCEGVANG